MFENVNQKENNCGQVITKKNDNAKDLIKKEIDKLANLNQVRNIDFYINVAVSWIDDYDDGAYLGCYSNKLDDVIVALYHNNTIYLLGETYKTIMYAPKIMFHMVDSTHIHIDDVLIKHNSVGNGSVVMTALLLYARHTGVNMITGSLSTIDDDHVTRRNKYYEKFGFEIQSGHVVKYL